jgi:hypothetical protein
MNKRRRKDIQEAIDHLEKASDLVQQSIDGEQEAFDNLPEQFQWSERGEAMEDAISRMGDALCFIDEALQATSEILN